MPLRPIVLDPTPQHIPVRARPRVVQARLVGKVAIGHFAGFERHAGDLVGGDERGGGEGDVGDLVADH